MVRVAIDIRKTVEENAAHYFEQGKKAKRKLAGIDAALERFRTELALLDSKRQQALEQAAHQTAKTARKKEWYEKFHWFLSSEGFLCIGGRDATTNDIVVKKRTDKNDLVFHTESPGSPFFIVKTQGKQPGDATIAEAAQATASYSRQWKSGRATADVYWILPEQVSKQAPTGESIGRGAFMIYGKRNYHYPRIESAVGLLPDGRVMGGPVTAVKKNCAEYVKVIPGDDKTAAAAKKIAKKIHTEDIDAIVAALPAGGVRLTT